MDVKNEIDKNEKIVEDYNQFLEQADRKGNEIAASDTKISDMNTAVLSSAKGKFTTDGSEVEQLGGKRKSERKKLSANQKIHTFMCCKNC